MKRKGDRAFALLALFILIASGTPVPAAAQFEPTGDPLTDATEAKNFTAGTAGNASGYAPRMLIYREDFEGPASLAARAFAEESLRGSPAWVVQNVDTSQIRIGGINPVTVNSGNQSAGIMGPSGSYEPGVDTRLVSPVIDLRYVVGASGSADKPFENETLVENRQGLKTAFDAVFGGNGVWAKDARANSHLIITDPSDLDYVMVPQGLSDPFDALSPGWLPFTSQTALTDFPLSPRFRQQGTHNPVQDRTGASQINLTFFHKYNLSAGDGAFLEVRVLKDGKWSEWRPVEPDAFTQNDTDEPTLGLRTDASAVVEGRRYEGGYTDPARVGQKGLPQNAWLGESGGMVMSRFILNRYAGTEMQLGFHVVSKAAYVIGTGWFVDDVNITAPVPPRDLYVRSVDAPRGSDIAPVGHSIALSTTIKNNGFLSADNVTVNFTVERLGTGTLVVFGETVEAPFLDPQQEARVRSDTLFTPTVEGDYRLRVRVAVANEASRGYDDINASETDAFASNNEGTVDFKVQNVGGVPRIRLALTQPETSVLTNARADKTITLTLTNTGNVLQHGTARLTVVQVDPLDITRPIGTPVEVLPTDGTNVDVPFDQTIFSLGTGTGGVTRTFRWGAENPELGIFRLTANFTSGIDGLDSVPILSYVRSVPAPYFSEKFESRLSDPDFGDASKYLRMGNGWNVFGQYNITIGQTPMVRQIPPEPVSAPYTLEATARDLDQYEQTPRYSLDDEKVPSTQSKAYGEAGSSSILDDYQVMAFLDLTKLTDYQRAYLTFWHAGGFNWTGEASDFAEVGRSQGRVEIYSGQTSIDNETANETAGTGPVEQVGEVNISSADPRILAQYNASHQWTRERLDVSRYIGHNASLVFHFRSTPRRLSDQYGEGTSATICQPGDTNRAVACDALREPSEGVWTIDNVQLLVAETFTQGTLLMEREPVVAALARNFTRQTTNKDTLNFTNVNNANGALATIRADLGTGVSADAGPETATTGIGWHVRDYAPILASTSAYQYENHTAFWKIDPRCGSPNNSGETERSAFRFARTYGWSYDSDKCLGLSFREPDPGGSYPLKGTYSILASPLFNLTGASQPMLVFEHNYTFDRAISTAKKYSDGGTVWIAEYDADGRLIDRKIAVPAADSPDQYRGTLSSALGGAGTGVSLGDHPLMPAYTELAGSFINETGGQSYNSTSFVLRSGVPVDQNLTSDPAGWVEARFDLKEYAGKRISVEFHAVIQNGVSGSSAVVRGQGWLIDNVRVLERVLANDVGIGEIVSPQAGSLVGTGIEQFVFARIANNGLFSQRGVAVHYNVTFASNGTKVWPIDTRANPTPPEMDPVCNVPVNDPDGFHSIMQRTPAASAADAIPGLRDEDPNKNHTLGFSKAWVPQDEGVYAINVWTRLENATEPYDDENCLNDRKKIELTVRNIRDAGVADAEALPDEAMVAPFVGGIESPRTFTVHVSNTGSLPLDFTSAEASERLVLEIRIFDESGAMDIAPIEREIKALPLGATVELVFPNAWVPARSGVYKIFFKVRLETLDGVPLDDDAGNDIRGFSYTVFDLLVPAEGETVKTAFSSTHPSWSLGNRTHNPGEGWSFGGADGYLDNAQGNLTLTTPLSTVSARNLFLSLDHYYDFETAYDGGRVEVSVDGVNWEAVRPTTGYPGELASASPLVTDLSAAKGAFTGQSGEVTKSFFNLGTASVLKETALLFQDDFNAATKTRLQGDWNESTMIIRAPDGGRFFFSDKQIPVNWSASHTSSSRNRAEGAWSTTKDLNVRFELDPAAVLGSTDEGQLRVRFRDWRALGVTTHAVSPSTPNDVRVFLWDTEFDANGAARLRQVDAMGYSTSGSKFYSDNYQDWTERDFTVPFGNDIQYGARNFLSKTKDRMVNLTFEHRLLSGLTESNPGPSPRLNDTDGVGPNYGWAFDDVEVYIQYKDGRHLTLYRDPVDYSSWEDAKAANWSQSWVSGGAPQGVGITDMNLSSDTTFKLTSEIRGKRVANIYAPDWSTAVLYRFEALQRVAPGSTGRAGTAAMSGVIKGTVEERGSAEGPYVGSTGGLRFAGGRAEARVSNQSALNASGMNFTGSFAAQIWFKADAVDGVILNRTDGAGAESWRLGLASGALFLHVDVPGAMAQCTKTGVLAQPGFGSTLDWHHAVVQRNSPQGRYELYVDGSLGCTTAPGVAIANAFGNGMLYVGSNGTGTYPLFAGSLADLRVMNVTACPGSCLPTASLGANASTVLLLPLNSILNMSFNTSLDRKAYNSAGDLLLQGDAQQLEFPIVGSDVPVAGVNAVLNIPYGKTGQASTAATTLMQQPPRGGLNGAGQGCSGNACPVPPTGYLPSAASLTVETWINTTDTDGSVVNFLNTAGYELGVKGGKAFFKFGVSGSPTLCQGSTNVSDSYWHHLLGVRDATTASTQNSQGQQLRLFVDGVIDKSCPFASTAALTGGTPSQLVIGTGATGGQFNGNISQTRVVGGARNWSQGFDNITFSKAKVWVQRVGSDGRTFYEANSSGADSRFVTPLDLKSAVDDTYLYLNHQYFFDTLSFTDARGTTRGATSGGRLEVSADDGVTWSPIEPDASYSGISNQYYDLFNHSSTFAAHTPFAGREKDPERDSQFGIGGKVFAGCSRNSGPSLGQPRTACERSWNRFNLTNYAGREVLIAFHAYFSTTDHADTEYWRIYEVKVQASVLRPEPDVSVRFHAGADNSGTRYGWDILAAEVLAVKHQENVAIKVLTPLPQTPVLPSSAGSNPIAVKVANRGQTTATVGLDLTVHSKCNVPPPDCKEDTLALDPSDPTTRKTFFHTDTLVLEPGEVRVIDAGDSGEFTWSAEPKRSYTVFANLTNEKVGDELLLYDNNATFDIPETLVVPYSTLRVRNVTVSPNDYDAENGTAPDLKVTARIENYGFDSGVTVTSAFLNVTKRNAPASEFSRSEANLTIFIPFFRDPFEVKEFVWDVPATMLDGLDGLYDATVEVNHDVVLAGVPTQFKDATTTSFNVGKGIIKDAVTRSTEPAAKFSQLYDPFAEEGPKAASTPRDEHFASWIQSTGACPACTGLPWHTVMTYNYTKNWSMTTGPVAADPGCSDIGPQCPQPYTPVPFLADLQSPVVSLEGMRSPRLHMMHSFQFPPNTAQGALQFALFDLSDPEFLPTASNWEPVQVIRDGGNNPFILNGSSSDFATPKFDPFVMDLESSLRLSQGFAGAKQFRLRFNISVGSSAGGWILDDVTISANNVSLGPRQEAPAIDDTDKVYRFVLKNTGEYSDDYRVEFTDENGRNTTVPAGWRIEITDSRGRPLVDASLSPSATVRLDPGQSETLRLRVYIPPQDTTKQKEGFQSVKLSAVSVQAASIRATSSVNLSYNYLDKPNLALQSQAITVDDLVPVGRPRSLDIAVLNDGVAEARQVRLQVVDKVVGQPDQILRQADGSDLPTLNIPAQQSRTLSVVFTPRVAGLHNLSVTVDPFDEILETNEADNVVVRSVEIRKASFPDLQLGVYVDNPEPKVDDTVHIDVDVANVGGAEAVAIQMTALAGVTDILAGEPPHFLDASIPAGSTQRLSLTWKAVFPGKFTLFIRAVTKAGVPELVETEEDNSYSQQIVVRSQGLVARLVTPAKMARQGETIESRIDIENRGNTGDTYLLSLELPRQWSGSVREGLKDARAMFLDNGTTGSVMVEANVPVDSTAGAYVANLRIASQNTSQVATVPIKVAVAQVHGLRAIRAAAESEPGTFPVDLAFDNTGNGLDTVTAQLVEAPFGWTVSAPQIAILPYERGVVPVGLTVPMDAEPGVYTLRLAVLGKEAKNTTSASITIRPKAVIAPSFAESALLVRPLSMTPLRLTLENLGNAKAPANITVGAPQGWKYVLERDSIVLATGDSKPVSLDLFVPADASVGDYIVSVTASTDEGVANVGKTIVRVRAPDLSVVDLQVTPKFNVKAGAPVTITVAVENQGDTSADGVPIGLYVDDTLVQSKTLPPLEPGERTSVTFEWVSAGGDHVLLAAVDPGRSIAEYDKDDNSRLGVLKVGGADGNVFAEVRRAVPGYEPLMTLALIGAAAVLMSRRRQM
ncbi:MAG: hypothetical protein HY556_11000 [Euryarchaeota archaeon]|nr:hypothetical protein [Euryarchaeota archaeon]